MSRPKTPLNQLSPTEHEILLYILDGMSNWEISKKRGCSYGLVGSMASKIYKKFGVNNRLKLIVTAQDSLPTLPCINKVK